MGRSNWTSCVNVALISLLALCACTALLAGCGGGGGSAGGGGGDGGEEDGGNGGPAALRAWVETEETYAGGPICAFLMVSDPAGIAGVDLDLQFNANLLSVSAVRTTTLTRTATMAYNIQPAFGSLAVSMARATGLTGGAGSRALLEMDFVVDPSAPSGTSLPLSVALDVYDERPSFMSLEVEDGEIAVQ